MPLPDAHTRGSAGCTLLSGLEERSRGCASGRSHGGDHGPGCTRFLDRMTESLREPVFILSSSGTLLHGNGPFARLFECEAGQIPGQVFETLLTADPQKIEVVRKGEGAGPNTPRDWEVILQGSGGETRELLIEATPLYPDEETRQVYLGTIRDVTETRSSERLVEQLTFTDPLTGLANLHRFQERLGKALLTPDLAERGLAVAWLAIDRLNLVRDSHGREAAEKLIVATAENLAKTMRERDLIAHVGGGRFALMLYAEHDRSELHEAIDRIVRMVSRPIPVGQTQVFVNVHVGLSVFPQDGVLADELISHAQTALSQTRSSRANRFRFYSRDMNLRAVERLELEECLRNALLRNELLLHYQPQIAIGSGEVVGLEALLRWFSPENGWVEPSRFIPLAESSGLIQSIGNWVLKTALAQLRCWMDKGMAPLRMAINVSPTQLLHPNFVSIVGRSLQENAIDPGLLELELTESTLMQYSDEALMVLRALKKMGVHLAIDDFGTGYSSLSYLKSFPVDRLKIDRSFLSGMGGDSKDSAIIEAVIGMGHGLGLEVVAEGVEQVEQYRFLAGSRCDIGQGFLWSRPQPSDRFPDCLGSLASFSSTPLSSAHA